MQRLPLSPGNSVSETGDKMNGGAVKLDKSPEKLAMLSCTRSMRITAE